MTEVRLRDIPSNDTLLTVDDLTLEAGGEALELTDDQIARARATGNRLEVAGEGDEIAALKGEALDQAVRDAGLEGTSSMTADQKRDALRDLRSEGE